MDLLKLLKIQGLEIQGTLTEAVIWSRDNGNPREVRHRLQLVFEGGPNGRQEVWIEASFPTQFLHAQQESPPKAIQVCDFLTYSALTNSFRG